MENGKGKSSKHLFVILKDFFFLKKNNNEDITRATVIYK